MNEYGCHSKTCISKNGYLHFPGFFKNDEVENIRTLIDNKLVNYPMMTDFITNNFMKRVDAQMNWNSKYTKYRVSNNNNSSDASVFHRDVIRISDQNPEFNELYTCLTYLDDATMQVILDSHKDTQLSITKTIDNFSMRKTIDMKPGDVLIFHSTMLHRGIFDKIKMSENRRLIQVFDVHPYIQNYYKFSEKILHMPSTGIRSDSSGLVDYLGHTPIISDVISYISYLNASTGYGRGSQLSDILKKHKIEEHVYLSSEGMQKRLIIADLKSGWGNGNLYVLNDKTHDITEEAASDVLFACFTKWIMVYSVILFLLLIIIIIVLYKAGNYLFAGDKNDKQENTENKQ